MALHVVFTCIILNAIWTCLYAGSIRDERSIYDENGIFQNDMLLSSKQKQMLARWYKTDDIHRKKRQIQRDPAYRWPNAEIPYKFVNYIDDGNKALIKDSMKYIQSVSCVRFREVTKDYGVLRIYFTEASCSASVGYQGDKEKERNSNALYLSSDCIKATHDLQHELLHVLGFWHMHSYPTRNEYIQINWRNINPNKEGDFGIFKGHEMTSFRIPYDCSSIMHYGPRADSIRNRNNLVTIEVNREHHRFCKLTNQKLTDRDICKINRMYNCPRGCRLLATGLYSSNE